MFYTRTVGIGRGARDTAPLDFDRSVVNPVSTRGADYAHHITICRPPPPPLADFQTFLRLCISKYLYTKQIQYWVCRLYEKETSGEKTGSNWSALTLGICHCKKWRRISNFWVVQRHQEQALLTAVIIQMWKMTRNLIFPTMNWMIPPLL